MRHLWQRTLGSERGSALLIGLSLITIMTLLGVALFEMTTIEASLVTKDGWELQAFYCAEAQAARIYNLYNQNTANNPTGDPTGSCPSCPVGNLPTTTLTLPSCSGQGCPPEANRTYTFSGSVTVNSVTQAVTITATCALPNGLTRTVQRGGTRSFLNPGYEYPLVGGGFDPTIPTHPQSFLGNLPLGGVGAPVFVAGPSSTVGGADTVVGPIYMSGTVYLRDQPSFSPYGAGDTKPRITTNPGGCASPPCVVNNTSPLETVTTASSSLNPMPSISNSGKTGILDLIEAAANPSGKPVMKGTFADPNTGATTTVYNLTEIFNQLRADSNSGGRNLAKPSGCTFGVAYTNENCRIWQDLVILGPQMVCLTPTSPDCAIGPKDRPSYYFWGIGAAPSNNPQGTSDATIWAAAVAANSKQGSELGQLGFNGTLGNYSNPGSVGPRLDVLVGTNIDGEGKATRIVDLTVDLTGANPKIGVEGLRSAPPIFYVDGYWRADAGVAGIAYNGRGTVVATKSMIVSDNLLYLNGLQNTNLQPPASCSNANDAANCGAGDMLALVAKDDIWMGDSNGTVHEISGLMMAGRDFNYYDYSSAGTCCQGPKNPVTFNGTVMASRQVAMVRDWAWPQPDQGDAEHQCTGAGGGCRPVAFFPTRPSEFIKDPNSRWCLNPNATSNNGCWVFMAMNTSTGILSPDSSKPAFNDGCVNTSQSPLTPATCPAGSRRIVHFQLNVRYDTRLKTAPGLIPLGVPTGGGVIYQGLGAAIWKDCGSNSGCS